MFVDTFFSSLVIGNCPPVSVPPSLCSLSLLQLCRGKYDPDAFKTVRSALSECGYLQDTEGGDESIGGAFKSHHDTAKNLKTVVIFPRITKPQEGNGDPQESGAELEQGASGVFDETTPDYMAAVS